MGKGGSYGRNSKNRNWDDKQTMEINRQINEPAYIKTCKPETESRNAVPSPFNRLRGTDELVIIFIYQHLQVSIKVLNFSSHFNMSLKKSL